MTQLGTRWSIVLGLGLWACGSDDTGGAADNTATDSPVEPGNGPRVQPDANGGGSGLPPSAEPSDEPVPPASGVAGGSNTPSPNSTSVPTPTTSTKLDVLFVVDNSLLMGPKQELLIAAVPRFLDQLLAPPLSDVHLGVISTSLGAYGAQNPCADASANQRDMAHLLGALRGSQPFVTWCSEGACGTSSIGEAATELVAQLELAGSEGCGWEASLESWYRFLIEPAPYTEVVRQNCPIGGDTNQLCVGPATDAAGTPLVDEALLQQRSAFLRPDSVLLIVGLSDEDDCSMLASGQTWRLSETFSVTPEGIYQSNAAFKGSAVCASNPNDPCCVSCGSSPPADCPTTMDASGQTVSVGCEERRYLSTDQLAGQGSLEASLDHVNLRCFEQKRRFGVNYLYPIERYTNALTRGRLCPTAPDLDPESCEDPAQVIANPLFASRAPSDVILANLVGVPWQDLAVDPAAASLEVRAATDLEWEWLIGERHPPTGIAVPSDPLMIAAVEPRTGVQPSTGVALQPPDAERTAHPANGHEWNIADRDELQAACIFELAEPIVCPSLDELMETGEYCACSWYSDARYQNPICQAPDGSFGLTQYFADARPGTRQLQLAYDVQEQAVVGSVCVRQTTTPGTPDYGYQPALDAVVRRVQQRFAP